MRHVALAVFLFANVGRAQGFSECKPGTPGNPSGSWPTSSASGTHKWSFDWKVDQEGLEVSNVKFNGNPVLSRGSLPYLPARYPANPTTCDSRAGNHSYSDALPASLLDTKTPFCCGPVLQTVCDLPDRGSACNPRSGKVSCSSGRTACTGVCVGTQLDNGTLEDNQGEVGSDDATADVVVTAVFRVGSYQFVQRWRFRDDMTIVPSVRLGGVHDCQLHNHQVYWRFDFDLASTPSEVVEQCDPANCTFAAVGCQCSARGTPSNPRWRITDSNVAGREITIDTGRTEGNAAAFCRGANDCFEENRPMVCNNDFDFCILRANGSEGLIKDTCRTGLQNAVSSTCSSGFAPGADTAFWYVAQVNDHDPCTFLPMCDPANGDAAFGPIIRLTGGAW